MKDLSGQSPSEIIQKLIDGEFTQSESQKFSEMVNSNPELKKEFNDYKKIKDSINTDKKQQLAASVPDATLKSNIFKELGFGKAVETPVAIGGGAKLLQYGSTTLTATMSWLKNYKLSIPSLAVVTAFTFFAFLNNGGNNPNSSKTTVVESKTENKAESKVANKSNEKLDNKSNNKADAKKIPLVSSNSGQSNTTNVDKFESKLDTKLDKKNNANNKENLAICTTDGTENKKSSVKTVKSNKNKSKQNSNNNNNSNSNTSTENVETNEAKIEIPNEEKKEGVLLLIENGIVYNAYSMAELRNMSNIANRFNPNYGIITPLKSKYNNNTDESNNVGVTLLFNGFNQFNDNEFTAAGYWKLNANSNYIIEFGGELNRVFLAPLETINPIDKIENSGKFDGGGLGVRFQSNGLLSEFLGSTFGELVNPYAGISIGAINPGIYGKLNAGVQLNILQISNFNIGFTAGYEYLTLTSKSTQFQSARQGIVTGFMVKF